MLTNKQVNSLKKLLESFEDEDEKMTRPRPSLKVDEGEEDEEDGGEEGEVDEDGIDLSEMPDEIRQQFKRPSLSPGERKAAYRLEESTTSYLSHAIDNLDFIIAGSKGLNNEKYKTAILNIKYDLEVIRWGVINQYNYDIGFNLDGHKHMQSAEDYISGEPDGKDLAENVAQKGLTLEDLTPKQKQKLDEFYGSFERKKRWPVIANYRSKELVADNLYESKRKEKEEIANLLESIFNCLKLYK